MIDAALRAHLVRQPPTSLCTTSNFQVVAMVIIRPAQLAELPRSVFDPELFPHSAYVMFCDIRDKSAVFNILRQNVTIFYIGNG